LTQRLYYTDSSLLEFDATITAVDDRGSQVFLSLDRSAFYPTSGGQNFDTGLVYAISNGARVRVIDVQDDEENGGILHVVECAPGWLQPGAPVRGEINAARRRDHMQQHSGQHVLSAAFDRLYDFATVSFHMSDDSCTIDLATDKVSPSQLEAAERLANEVIAEDRPVEIRFATPDEARAMGVRKIPQAVREKLRLIDIHEFDLNACGGTHVRSTGQIGAVLLRKTEKVKQGVRVEFVCGLRAVNTARRDFQTLTEAAAIFSTHLWEVPQQVRKSLDEIKGAQKAQHRLLEEVAELQAADLLRTAGERPSGSGQKLIVEFYPKHDLAFIKMLAQKLVRMGTLMRETLQKLGTRGGGNRDLAQGGAPDALSAEQAVREAASAIG
jgi:alanyl-tRNA synthetase